MRRLARPFATMSVAMIVGACSADEAMRADPLNARQVASGRSIYDRHCASCHGGNLEGQPEWRSRLPNGRLPAPPHDDSGHTWHLEGEAEAERIGDRHPVTRIERCE
jgi:cytochrome c